MPACSDRCSSSRGLDVLGDPSPDRSDLVTITPARGRDDVVIERAVRGDRGPGRRGRPPREKRTQPRRTHHRECGERNAVRLIRTRCAHATKRSIATGSTRSCNATAT